MYITGKLTALREPPYDVWRNPTSYLLRPFTRTVSGPLKPSLQR